MLREYNKSQPIKIKDGEEEKIDVFNTEIILQDYPQENQKAIEKSVTLPYFNFGIINKDFAEISDSEIMNIIISPEVSLIGNQDSRLGSFLELNKSVVIKYYKNLTPEQILKILQFSVKDILTIERNNVNIIQNVLRTVEEARQLDAERIPLMTDIINSIIDVFNAVSKYSGGNPAPPMNTVLTPNLIQNVSDAVQEFKNKDEEYRDLLSELTEEYKEFIK